MFDEAPENRGFELRSGFVVNRHGALSIVVMTANLAASKQDIGY
jgi:hypothetical protein